MDNISTSLFSDATPMPERYMQIPSSLLECAKELDLKPDHVYLYILLYNRAKFSKFVNDEGKIYVIYTRAEVQQLTGWSRSKVIKVFHSLAQVGLIEEVAQTNRAGRNIALHIYVKQWQVPCHAKGQPQFSYLTDQNKGIKWDNYYTIPFELTEMSCKLSIRARILYAVLLDQITLSITFNRQDDHGFWCAIQANEAISLLQCSHGTLSNTYAELIQCGLIARARKENGCEMHTYLYPCWSNAFTEDSVSNTDSSSVSNVEPQLSENEDGNYPEITPQPSNSATQSILIHQDPFNNPHSGSSRRNLRSPGAAEKEIRNRLDYFSLDRKFLTEFSFADSVKCMEILNAAIGLMARHITGGQTMFRIRGEYVHRTRLINAYSQLRTEDMAELIRTLLPKWDTLDKPMQYLQTALYRTAIETHGI